jgi:hypothetical protein
MTRCSTAVIQAGLHGARNSDLQELLNKSIKRAVTARMTIQPPSHFAAAGSRPSLTPPIAFIADPARIH